VNFIWVTRGRTWGFRVLRTGGLDDPFETYEAAFAGLEDAPDAYRAASGRVAVRFPDPEERRDRAGRVISHEFVLLPPLAERVHDLATAKDLLWPKVSDTFHDSWDAKTAPSSTP
jgi:hypothetical protein